MKDQENSTFNSFREFSALFNAATPQQVRDQVIWQGIRFIMHRLAASPDDLDIIEVQDRIFRMAQQEASRQEVRRVSMQ